MLCSDVSKAKESARIRLKVTEFHLHSSGVPRFLKGNFHRPQTQAVIEVDSISKGATSIAPKGDKAVWNYDVILDLEKEAQVAIKVYNHSEAKNGTPEWIGEVTVDCSFVSKSSEPKVLSLDVMNKKKVCGRVYVEVSAYHEDDQSSKEGTVDDLGSVIRKAEAKILAFKPSYDRFSDVLTGMNVILTITAPLAELPLPGLKTAHDILRRTYELLEEQKERDQNVENLAFDMAQLWTIFSEVKGLDMIKSMQDVIIASIEQTRACAEFLDKYAETGILKRFVTGYFVADERISAFQAAFRDLKDRITRGTSLQTWIIVVRNHAELTEKMDLHGLSEARDASYNEARTCIANTRQKDLERILRWVDDPSANGVYWLTGVAGCGKSTITHTVAKVLSENHRLGASFFFNRTDALLNNPRLFCTTLASHLARYDSSLRRAILDAIKTDPGIDAKPLPNQIGPLVSMAVQKLKLSVPLVLVFDALDESGNPESRKEFMAMLRKELPILSAHVKVLITSRDEDDIRAALPLEAARRPHRADVKDETRTDVRLYIQTQLREVVRRFPRLENWPTTDEITRMAERADGLFIWASVACNYILDGPDHDPEVHLETILSTDPAERAKAELSLDTLYLTILRRKPIDPDNFRYIMGSIVTLRDPLSLKDLDSFLGLEKKNAKPEQRLVLTDGTKVRLTTCEGVVASLASILNSDGRGTPVRIVHASVFDFLVNSARSEEFHIDIESAQRIVLERCLARMTSLLRFDICGLRNPSKLNLEFPDLEDRILACIPGDLKYACDFWVSHLLHIRYPTEALVSNVTGCLSRYLLHWFEVISLLGHTRHLSPLLRGIVEWSKRLHLDGLTSLARDCFHFVQEFSPMMEVSALHLYISAMVFCPRTSLVYKTFDDSSSIPLPEVTCVEDGALTTPVCSVYQGHSDVVYSMRIFPAGDKIVSAGAGPSIHIWDPASGTLVREPIRGYEGSVLELAVSGDGLIIAASTIDEKLHLWHALTGERIGKATPIGSRTLGLAFLPDNTRLASSSDDGQIRIWNADSTMSMARAPLVGHSAPLIHITVSPDGKILAATSRSSTELWSLATWEPMGGVLEPGDSAIAFAPDSRRLALGRYVEHCVFLWDLSSRRYNRLDGHTKAVNAVAFSPDGRILASGSSDSVIRLWNGVSGEALRVLRGHTHTLWVLQFSPDGTQLVSASADKTVRVWDVESCLESWQPKIQSEAPHILCVACSPDSTRLAFSIGPNVFITSTDSSITILRRHSGEVKFVGFSPDGSRLVSASQELLQWWDTRTNLALDTVPLTGTEKARYIEISPDHSRLAITLEPKSVLMCSAANGKQIGEPLTEHLAWIRAIAFSPDGSWLATAADDNSIRLRDPVSGAQTGKPIPVQVRMSAIAFSPDGKYLAAGCLSDATMRLWNASTRELVWTYSGDIVGKIYRIVFTPDGKQLISAAANGAAFVLDVPSGSRVGRAIRCFNGAVRTLTSAHGGTHLFAATDTLQVWVRKGDQDAWVFRRELYPSSEIFWRENGESDGPFLASFHEHPDGWLTSSEGHKILWIPEHLRRVWSPFRTFTLRLGRESATVSLNLHDYLVWLTGITGTSFEVDEEWSSMPVSGDFAGVHDEIPEDGARGTRPENL